MGHLDWMGLRLLARLAPLGVLALMLYEPTRLWVFSVFMDTREAAFERTLEGSLLDPTR